jgi:cytochrome c peroxidase
MRILFLCLLCVACDDGGPSSGAAPPDAAPTPDASDPDATSAPDAAPAPDAGQDSGAPDARPDRPPRPDAGPQQTLDELLAEVLAAQPTPVVPLAPPAPADPALYALGQALFFDPILSGNQDVACASCHHPNFGLGDGLPLAVGTGARGLGPDRLVDAPAFVPRHAPALFERGDPAWRRLFADGRVELDADSVLRAPIPLPDGLSGVLAAQALIPLFDRSEMRGQPGDRTVSDEPNELAALPDDDPAPTWDALMARLLAIPAYGEAFAAAYPALAGDPPTIAHVANAIAAFEATAFSFTDTPWDAWLRGDADALTDAQKLGAVVFHAGTACSRCHSGPLFTDQRFHNVGIPQLGPGRGDAAPFDVGRAGVTEEPADRFTFRTAPLRNLGTTAPFMHNGALPNIGAVMNHYAQPADTAAEYDAEWLPEALRDTVQRDPAHLDALRDSLSPELLDSLDARSAVGLSNVREFLRALDDPAAADLSHLIPESVPSGLSLP